MACHLTIDGKNKVYAYGEGEDIHKLYIKDRKKEAN
jgi:hypothetical protein